MALLEMDWSKRAPFPNGNLDHQPILVAVLQRNWLGLRNPRSGSVSSIQGWDKRRGLDICKKRPCSGAPLVVALLALWKFYKYGACVPGLDRDVDGWIAHTNRLAALTKNWPRLLQRLFLRPYWQYERRLPGVR